MALGNEVLIGKKPVMDYVTAVIFQFNTGSDEVILKAKGNMISRAVDVAEIVKKRYMGQVKLDGFAVNSEVVRNREGQTRISTMELTLKK
ncbi:MAG: DNA-binding protein Alba [Candidatus Nanoarchaeia archaeon]|nr:DNA-binding protein Alba [Candidatus Nanoarchaeia archaeon]